MTTQTASSLLALGDLPFRVIVEIDGGLCNEHLHQTDDLEEALSFAATVEACGSAVYGDERETVAVQSTESGWLETVCVIDSQKEAA